MSDVLLQEVLAKLTGIEEKQIAFGREQSEMKRDLAEVKAEQAEMKRDLAEVKAEQSEMKRDLAEVKAEQAEMKRDLAYVKAEMRRDLAEVREEQRTMREEQLLIKQAVLETNQAVQRVEELQLQQQRTIEGLVERSLVHDSILKKQVQIVELLSVRSIEQEALLKHVIG